MRRFILAALLPLALAASVAQACPNASPSITVPMSGEAILTVYDPASCNPLQGPFTVQIPGASLTSTSKPAVTADSTGLLHFTANGASFGTKIAATVQFSPDSTKSQALAIIVGGPVSGLTFGTTTP